MAKVHLTMTSLRGMDFFASNHKCNHAKAVMAHSSTMVEANETFRLRHFSIPMRKRFLKTYGKYLGQTDMTNVPMSPEVNPTTGEMYVFWMDELEMADDITMDELLMGKHLPPLAWDVAPPATATTNKDYVASWKGGVPPYDATIKGPVDLNNETVAVPPLNIDMNVDGTNQPVGKYTWKVTDAAGTSITADTTVS